MIVDVTCFLRCRRHSMVFLTWRDLWFLGADLRAVGPWGDGVELGLQLFDVPGLMRRAMMGMKTEEEHLATSQVSP